MYRINLSSQMAALAMLSMIFATCSNQKQRTSLWRSGIQEPFENIAIGCNGNEIDAQKGGEIFFASGTKLYIPPDAFVDEKGNVVEGKVTVNYREFHSSGEIMVSGIPMKFNNGGVIEDFESAGMFDLTANADGSPLNLAPGKQIDMWLASDKRDVNFNFYRFDSDNNEWVELSTEDQEVVENEQTVTTENVRAVIAEPLAPQPINKNEPIFEFTPGIDAGSIGEVDELAVKLWQVEGFNRLTEDELDILRSSAQWDKYKLRPLNPAAGNYELLIDQGNKRYRMVVKPVLFGKELRKAKGEYAKAMNVYEETYQTVMDSLTAQLEATNRQMSFFRMVSVAQLGIYNCDRYIKRRQTIAVEADFQLADGKEINSTGRFYNVITNDDGSNFLVSLSPSLVQFDKTENNNLIAILPGDKVAVLANEQFKQMDIRGMKRSGKATFKLELLENRLNSVEDLDVLLASL